MELNSVLITTPPRAASSVIMLRDGDSGLEVFLLRRHGLSDVLGGAYVFPGGKVDPADGAIDAQAHLDEPAQTLHAALNEPDIDAAAAAGLYVAALREAFEESGVLFARDASAATARQATALLREGRAFDEVLAELHLRLATRMVRPWSRWITPRLASVSSKRFDTRFFVSAVPMDQIARHDDHEATESIWLTPRAALTQYWDGLIQLAPPQIMTLSQLSRHADVSAVMHEAGSRPPPTIEPEPFDQDGTRVLCYPGDERHTVQRRAMTGPTRLYYRNKRFEPAGGFAALLG
jgi:8-oxo-dGTP pyrophosphatase MutT (NUDIX family)